jgi:hypothetical protein
MIQKYRHHSIEVKESGTISYTQGKRMPPDYVHHIQGLFFSSYTDKGYESGFKSPDEALTAAKKIIDMKFEQEEDKANLRRYLVEQDYEYFVNYLRLRNITDERVDIIASTLTLASTQKEVSTEGLDVKVDGDVNASINGSVDASVSGSVDANLDGKVDANVSGSVFTE